MNTTTRERPTEAQSLAALEDVGVRFGRTRALDSVRTTIAPGLIYGLIGRNGAGKTTLLSLLASYRRPNAGRVSVLGDDPFEDALRMSAVHFIFARDVSDESDTVQETLEHCARYRSDFDLAYALELVERFGLDPKKSLSALSLGMQSAVNAIEGLASGAALTLFDEVHHGMDAPSRTLFYDTILDRREATGRTFILSTHLVSETAYLFDHVLILDKGRLVADEPQDELLSRGTTVTGDAVAVDRFTAGRAVISRKTLGPTAAAMVYEVLDQPDREAAVAAGLELAPASLQDLFIHLTEPEQPATNGGTHGRNQT
ncbi:MAG: ABC transporter ATP-binding protein [Spirochaetaceae bacterium]|nr:MAG: ABC transporter ATP-binding protein [Spirochaetaceae bacterium]